MVKEENSKLGFYKKRLFLYTTGMMAMSMLFINLTAPKHPSFLNLIVVYAIFIVLSLLTIASSVWLLSSKQALIKKITAVLYILVSLMYIAVSCYIVVISLAARGLLVVRSAVKKCFIQRGGDPSL